MGCLGNRKIRVFLIAIITKEAKDLHDHGLVGKLRSSTYGVDIDFKKNL